MRSMLLGLPLLFAVDVGPALPACGEAALANAPDAWDAASFITGDLNDDGKEDVVFWKQDGDALLLYLAACDGERPVETWRFRVARASDCPPGENIVQITDVLLDAAMVERVCTTGYPDECAHLRRENEARRKRSEAGARQLRIGGPGCPGTRFRWSAEHGGFMRIGA